MNKLLSLSFAALFAVAIVFGGTVSAQEQQGGGSGFRLSPTRGQLTLNKGESRTEKIFIRNVSGDTQTARAVVDDFSSGDNETGSPQLLIGDLAVDDYPYSIKPFVLSIADVELEPGEEKEVLATFSVPDDASPGSYFGLVRFISVQDEIDGNFDSAVSLTASVGTIYLIDVPGETVDLVNLEQISVLQDGSSGSFFSSAPDSVAIRLKNEGNTFQAPFGKVLVKNWSGDVVYQYELNEISPRGNVLPETIRRFENDLENIGSFGRFTVEANLSYGDGGNIISATSTFWVVPWVTVGLGLAGLVALGFIGTRGVKAYNKRVLDKAKGSRVKKK